MPLGTRYCQQRHGSSCSYLQMTRRTAQFEHLHRHALLGPTAFLYWYAGVTLLLLGQPDMDGKNLTLESGRPTCKFSFSHLTG